MPKSTAERKAAPPYSTEVCHERQIEAYNFQHEFLN